jgi:hypothetical protein
VAFARMVQFRGYVLQLFLVGRLLGSYPRPSNWVNLQASCLS